MSPKVERSARAVKSRPFRFFQSVVVSVTASSFGRASVVCWPSVEWGGFCWDGGSYEGLCAKTRLAKAGRRVQVGRRAKTPVLQIAKVHGWTGGKTCGWLGGRVVEWSRERRNGEACFMLWEKVLSFDTTWVWHMMLCRKAKQVPNSPCKCACV